jgi:C-terminal processing protease CtpA/Prc
MPYKTLTHLNNIFSRIVILYIVALLSGCTNKIKPCFLTAEEATSELKSVKKLLEERSPFVDIQGSNVLPLIDSLVIIINQKKEVNKYEFSLQMKEILSNLGDRHFSLSYKNTCDSTIKYYLPFALSPFQDSLVIALKKEPKAKFSIYDKDFPLLKKINGMNAKDFIYQNDQENRNAAHFSSLAKGVEKLNEFYKIKQGLRVGDKIKVTLSSWDLKSDTTVELSIVEAKDKWRDMDSYLTFNDKNSRLNQKLYRRYPKRIAYIKLPEMYSLQNKTYFKWLQGKMDSLRNSSALIIDLRNNSGGGRDLINFFSNYLIPPGQFIVANIARYKGNISNEAKDGLKSRSLFTYRNFKEPEAQATIDAFMKGFHPDRPTDDKKYSEYFYMILSSKKESGAYFYDKPVYILTNEMTFSAASVFASAFKGINKIKTAGVLTDGSSGLSVVYDLKNSGIQLRLSNMLSYQKNGLRFDGIGTSADLKLDRSISQILGKEDYQLKKLLEVITMKIISHGKV